MKIDLVDVFARTALGGNPLAVVHGGEDLDERAMLRLTQWLGFSETTFLLPPTHAGADYRVRIFYPAGELPFAGHPTLGSAFAWLSAGGVPARPGRVVQECGVGLVEVEIEAGAPERLAFVAPPLIRSGPLSDADRDEAALSMGLNPASVVEAVHVANGPDWRLLRLSTAAEVLAARPVSRAPIGTDIGLAAPAAEGSGADWEVRAFFADQHGALVEDPVTGSFNAGVALHLFATGLAKGSYVARQGRVTGADGEVRVRQGADGRVWVGGRCAMVAAQGALAGLADVGG